MMKGKHIMNEKCFNRLYIKGEESAIKDFLKDFHTGEKFSMELIVPYNYNFSETWKYKNWGTTHDIFNCSSMNEVMGSYKEENNEGRVSMTYSTAEIPNETFCKKASKLYPELIFVLTFYEPTCLFAGRTTFKKGYESSNQSIFYELNDDNQDKFDESLINIYDFAIEEDFTSVTELATPLKKVSQKVKSHFYHKNEEGIVLDFEELKQEYINEHEGDK
jgi:hypothetical protein